MKPMRDVIIHPISVCQWILPGTITHRLTDTIWNSTVGGLCILQFTNTKKYITSWSYITVLDYQARWQSPVWFWWVFQCSDVIGAACFKSTNIKSDSVRNSHQTCYQDLGYFADRFQTVFTCIIMEKWSYGK